MSYTKPTYRILKQTDDIVLIEDTCDETGARSVTNAAEDVVEDLTGMLQGRRLLYIDTMGEQDELLHDGQGKFLGFKPARDVVV